MRPGRAGFSGLSSVPALTGEAHVATADRQLPGLVPAGLTLAAWRPPNLQRQRLSQRLALAETSVWNKSERSVMD